MHYAVYLHPARSFSETYALPAPPPRKHSNGAGDGGGGEGNQNKEYTPVDQPANEASSNDINGVPKKETLGVTDCL